MSGIDDGAREIAIAQLRGKRRRDTREGSLPLIGFETDRRRDGWKRWKSNDVAHDVRLEASTHTQHPALFLPLQLRKADAYEP